MQGVAFYRAANDNSAGLMHWSIGGYDPSDVEFVRRIFFDVIGRPPTPDQVEAFLRDRSKEKRARLIAFSGSARTQARMLLAMLEGAMVVARGMRHRTYFQGMARNYLLKLKAA